MTDFDHQSNRKVDQVIGAFFLVKRDLFLNLNGFDERFFVYYEEVDFALRAKSAGWNTYFYSESSIIHAGGGTSSQVKAERLFYSNRSRILYSFKHFEKYQAVLVLFLTVFIEPFSRIMHSILKLSLIELKNTLWGSFLLIKNLPDIYKTYSDND